MRTLSRLLSSSLCFSLLLACGPVPEDTAAEMESQAASIEGDDSHSQGTQLHGTSVEAIRYADAAVMYDGNRRAAKLLLHRGTLEADMTLQVQGTTPSLAACLLPTSGPERSCGFTVAGQGVCTPGTQVTLSTGTCSGTTGSCSGKPILRVCADEKPCEHQGPGYLGHGVPTPGSPLECAIYCPKVTFTCPASGIYTVLDAPMASSQTQWSAPVRTLTAPVFPAKAKRLRGAQLIGARMGARRQSELYFNTTLEIVDARNANTITIPESPGIWDDSGETFLYRVKVRPPPTTGAPSVDLCTTGVDPNVGWGWAAPLSGTFSSAGNRSESTEHFTFACDPGVLAKCYRWGYKPWLDGTQSGGVTMAHWACTRMARADYCGNGTSFTQDGTKIRPWDSMNPSIIPAPQSPPPADMTFEAGWRPEGPACLSHWRWQHLEAPCVQLNAPKYDQNGNITNDCRLYPTMPRCAEICDSAQEAKQYYQSIVFNESKSNQLPQP
ncbi:ADYC domain-containing protein [Myxococcus stipitatus]|uniref:ADYC domain-containing protein n=1 Tax=Myxococcus stipitatus TaxID=83455 RepID=UPI0031452772